MIGIKVKLLGPCITIRCNYSILEHASFGICVFLSVHPILYHHTSGGCGNYVILYHVYKCESESESAKYSKHLINRVLHGAPIIEVIFLREEKPVLALLMLSAKQGSHWYHF